MSLISTGLPFTYSTSLISEDELLNPPEIRRKIDSPGRKVLVSSIICTALLFIFVFSWYETLRVAFDITFNDKDKDKGYLVTLSFFFSVFVSVLVLVIIVCINRFTPVTAWS